MAKDELQKDLEELNSLDTNKAVTSEAEDEDYEDFDDYEDYDDDIYDFSKPESSAGSLTSLVLGIIASLGWIIPIIGLPVTIVGIVLGAINLKNRQSKGLAIAGFVVNIVFLCASIAKGIVDIVRYAKKSK